MNQYNLVISSTILVARTCLGFFKSLITTWWGDNFIVLPSPKWVIWYTNRRLQERIGTHNTSLKWPSFRSIVPDPTTILDLSLPTDICLVLDSLKVEKLALSLAIWEDDSELISHSIEEVDIALKEKLEAESAFPWEKELEEEE